jgi:glycerophosphoryl diester phosphodiesterase
MVPCRKWTITMFSLVVLAFVPTQSGIAMDEPWAADPWIAHALGGIGHDHYVNSWEAFFHNYHRHFKLFEVDLTFTGDEQLVANHDWSGYEHPPNYQAFMKSRVKGKYHPMDLNGVIWLLDHFPDIYIITDTKETDKDLIRKQFTLLVQTVKKHNPVLLNRLIPEIYNPQMHQIVNEIHPFLHQIYSTYMLEAKPREIIDFMKSQHLRVIALPIESVSKNYIQQLKKHDFVVLVHPINTYEQLHHLKELGVSGVYTDVLTPTYLRSG